MKGLAALAAAAALVAALGSNSPAGAADGCPSTGSVDVLPLHAPIGVHHKVNLILLPDFELNRLVPGSLSFHVTTPTGSLDLPGGNDSLGASFTAGAIGGYTVAAHWKLYDCGDRSTTADAQSQAGKFQIFHERRPRARFRSSVVPGRAVRKAPIFAVTANCPPSTIGIAERLQLTVYYEVGSKTPTRHSPHTSQVLPKGCGGADGPKPTTKNFRWGVTRGATIGVLPGNAVRVLAEVKSGSKIVDQTRVRFAPRGDKEAFVRDAGRCTGGCVKRIFKY
jgi:hypothetical protein